jgi:anti-sigma B factor antagonist
MQAVRGHQGLPCATRHVLAHVIGGAVAYSAAHEASLRFTSPADRGGYAIAALSGDLGIASAPALREQLRSLLRAASHLIIDLSAVEHADASGLAVLVSSGHRARLLGGSLRLAAPSPKVARVLSATGMNQHLDVFPTVRAAITGQPGQPNLPAGSRPGSWPPHRCRHRGRGCTTGHACHGPTTARAGQDLIS